MTDFGAALDFALEVIRVLLVGGITLAVVFGFAALFARLFYRKPVEWPAAHDEPDLVTRYRRSQH